MAKKEDHNIPKDYDEKLKSTIKAENHQSIDLIGGSIKPVKTQRRPMAKPNVKKVAGSLGLVLVVVSVIVAGLFIFRSTNDQNNDVVLESYEKTVKEAVDLKEEQTSGPLDPNASDADKKVYYSNVTWLNLQAGKDAEAVKYYIEVIKPSNVKLSSDLNEALARKLITAGNNSEAKELIGDIIAEYTTASSNSTSDYVTKKLIFYRELEKTL